MAKKAENKGIVADIENFIEKSLVSYNEEQTIAFLMLYFNLFYDDAKRYFELYTEKQNEKRKQN